MDIALLSILALVVAILIGVWRSDINVGIVSLAFAFGIALFSPGLDVAEIPSFLPSDLLLMLIGVTLTFGMIRANGTLDWMANGAVGAVRSKPAFLPIIFFLLTFILSAIGPGNIAATAIIAPIGMAVASRAGISPMLMAIMICTGANAAAFSPIAPTGVINTELLKSIGITDPGVPLQVFLGAAGLQTVTALFAWVLFGRKRTREVASKTTWFDSQPTRRGTKNDYLMLVAILILLLMVLVFQVGIGASTIIVGLLLALFRIG
ncbi:MAG: SLC13 family permease, partial [Candidatus Kapaibacterium sp.]